MATVKLITYTPDPEKVVAAAAKLCYSKSDITTLMDNLTEDKVNSFLDTLSNLGHQSPFEHVSFTFGIEGVSRSFLAQITRHRIGCAFSCVSGDTILRTGGGKKITIRDFYENSIENKRAVTIRCVDEKSGVLNYDKVAGVYYTGEKEVYEVTTSFGYKVKTTNDHRFLCEDGIWRPLSEIQVGDRVMVNGRPVYMDKEWLYEQYIVKNKSLSEIADFCGVSNTCIDTWLVHFGIIKRNITEKKIYQDKDWLYQKYIVENLSLSQIGELCGVNSRLIQTYCQRFGLYKCGIKEAEKYPYKNPEWLKKQYWDNGLSVQEIADICGVGYDCIRKWIAIAGLQKPLGTGMTGREPPNKGRSKEEYEPMNRTSQKMIGNKNGCYGPKGADRSNWKGEAAKDCSKRNRVYRCIERTGYCENCGFHGATELHHIDKDLNHYTKDNIMELCSTCHHAIHRQEVTQRIIPNEIISIEYIGVESVYDIEMAGEHHNFVGNGFILHNCQSQRYVDMNSESCAIPEQEYMAENGVDWIFEKAYEDSFKKYNEIKDLLTSTYIANGMEERAAKKKAQENARYVLPEGCNTKMIVTMNARELLHFFELRCCNRAQTEIRDVAYQMLALVYPIAPHLFRDAGPACVRGACQEGKMSCGKAVEVREYVKNVKNL